MPYADVEKQKQAQHESYLRNKAKVAEASKKARDKRRAIIKEFKESSPCMDCGVWYPHYVMDFDHRDADEKVNSIANMLDRVSMKLIFEEIKKCDLVCSNCHRIRTWMRLQS